ncbi:MAG TPA: lasso peptide biosynthesis B2 protein [Steroidobacteraceae bacterium]|jgi:hypothetical protein
MGRYSLADHVFVCVNDAHVVLLDLKQDRYWALEADQTAPLAGLVPGWPVATPRVPEAVAVSEAQAEESAEAEEVAAALAGQGILAPDAAGKDATPVNVTRPGRELLSAHEYEPAPIRFGTVIKFVAASLVAKVSLRLAPFERVVRRFGERKRVGIASTQPLDVERTRRLVETFFRLRVFAFSSRDECLFDSLALLGFLARHDVYADWVFGVQARPFAAHCWVQQGEIVFNDTVEHVSGFTPIMAA